MRTSMRYTGVAAAACAAALLITGCGSDGDGDKAKDEPSNGAPSGKESSAPAEGGGEVSGAYVAKAGDRPIVLYISDGKAALAGPHTCSGDYAGGLVNLKCADGDTDRTMGKVTPSADGKTLTVDWDALSEDDTFTKTDSPGGLPTGLPTNLPSGLPSGLPTGIPSAGG